jgi:hypothetical protein
MTIERKIDEMKLVWGMVAAVVVAIVISLI